MDLTITDISKLTGKSRKTIAKRLSELSYSDPRDKLYPASTALRAIYAGENLGRLDRINHRQISELTSFSQPTIIKRLEAFGLKPDSDDCYDSLKALSAVLLSSHSSQGEQSALEYEPIQQPNEALTYDHWRTVHMRAKAEKEALELAKEQGRYILSDSIADRLTTLFKVIRTRLLSIGTRVAQTISSEDNAYTLEHKINQEVAEILNELSRIEI